MGDMYGGIKVYKGTYPKRFTLISGETRAADDQSVIACCTSVTHGQRFLTLSDIQEHQCFFKKCKYLRKLPGNPFWEEPHDEYKKQSQRHFSEKGQIFLRKRKENWRAIAEKKCVAIANFCENWVKENYLEQEIKVISAMPFKNSTLNFRVFYVSDTSWYDAPEYTRMATAVHNQLGCRIKLVHIKDINGRRVTIADYERIKKQK